MLEASSLSNVSSLPAPFLLGVAHFNRREFFEAHEAWEEIWKETTGRDHLFYKGLIHAAVALHHFSAGNRHGARKVFASCVQYLARYQPRHLGIDVNGLLDGLQRCFQPMLYDRDAPARWDESLIPRIDLADFAHGETSRDGPARPPGV